MWNNISQYRTQERAYSTEVSKSEEAGAAADQLRSYISSSIKLDYTSAYLQDGYDLNEIIPVEPLARKPSNSVSYYYSDGTGLQKR